jgi:alpha-mannosidase
MVLSFFPTGVGEKPNKLIEIISESATISAMKRGYSDNEYVIRVFNPTGEETIVKAVFPIIDSEYDITLKRSEFKTIILNTSTGSIYEADILENIIT